MREPDPEQELRVLLDRAVPRLEAPPDRMDRILWRVRRRRRRRAAAVGAFAATAAVVALVRPWTPAPAPDSRASAASSPATSDVRFPDLADLVVTAPKGWDTVTVEVRSGTTVVGYVGSQKLTSPALSCNDELGGGGMCSTGVTLRVVPIAIAFRLVPDPEHRAEDTPQLAPPDDTNPDERDIGCGLLGMEEQVSTVRWAPDDVAGEGRALRTSMCADEKPTTLLGPAKALMNSVAFAGDGTPAPSVTVYQ
ncbi:hypothetical protein ACIQNU_30935 [Streptomyces sp. NPDC091292]|uniref:hypothetical protein n=1 Tax=Streptomyces sp. NPDC091292 TaxID=3365991 RepID=UPI0037F426B2